MHKARAIERRRLVVEGIVQGVGFRPFVHRLALRHGLGGFALNDGRGVLVEVEGQTRALDSFAAALTRDVPALARVDAVEVEPLAPRGEGGFRIEASVATSATALIPPDAATCDQCLRELWDPRTAATATRSSTALSAGRGSRSFAGRRTTASTRR